MRKLRKIIGVILALAVSTVTVMPVMGADGTGSGDLCYDGLREVLNSIPLEPKTTGYEELDSLVADILSQIIAEDMDTHDKLKACYDYIIENTEYGSVSGKGYELANSKESNDDTYWCVYGAYDLLTEHRGTCGNYSNAFLVLARAIGLNMEWVSGETHSSNGNFTPHSWVQLHYGDVDYIFDAQIEDSIAIVSGSNSYYRFGGTLTQLSDKYHFHQKYNVIFE